jgi:hypothetical protein
MSDRRSSSKGDELDGLLQFLLVQRACPVLQIVSTAQTQPGPLGGRHVGLHVAGQHRHTEGPRHLGHSPPDVPDPHNAKRFAGQAPALPLVAILGGRRLVGQQEPPGECQQQGKGVLRHRRITEVRHVADRDTGVRAGVQIDLTHAG